MNVRILYVIGLYSETKLNPSVSDPTQSLLFHHHGLTQRIP